MQLGAGVFGLSYHFSEVLTIGLDVVHAKEFLDVGLVKVGEMFSTVVGLLELNLEIGA